MPLKVAIGKSTAPNGQDASAEAVDVAFSSLGAEKPALAFVFVSEKHQEPHVIQGLNARLRNIPLLGFSTRGMFVSDNSQTNTLVVVLLAGENLLAKPYWHENFQAGGNSAAQNLLAELAQDENANLLLVADGEDRQTTNVITNITDNVTTLHSVLGCLPHGYPVGSSSRGVHAEAGCLAALQVAGNIHISSGTAHGWHPIGKYFKVTKTSGNNVLELNHKPPAEAYAELFGLPTQDWLSPPLNELVRVYPLGVEKSPADFQIHSQKRIRTDGVFEMVTAIPEGSIGHVMIASPTSCGKAIELAVKKAKENLGEHEKPSFAMVFADLAYKYMFDAQAASIESILGRALEGVPFAGGYTMGQIQTKPESNPEIITQHIQVNLFS